MPENYNNFGPAIGFAYQLPWFGEGKTTIRGGYQQTFGAAGANRADAQRRTEGISANAPGVDDRRDAGSQHQRQRLPEHPGDRARSPWAISTRWFPCSPIRQRPASR